MPTLAAPLDLAKLEARNLRAHQLTTAPSSPVTGQLYYNTTDNTLYWFNGTAWQSATGGGAPEVWSGTGAPAPIATYLMWIDTDDPTPVHIVASATTTTLGAIQLAGDLTGTATAPQIAAGAVTDTDVAAANKDGAAATPSMRTLGTGSAQACSGTDARLSDSRAPTGTAGGDLTGSTYPNPVVAALAITDAKVAAANKDGVAGTYSMRTLGTGAQQAMVGNTRLDTIAAPTTSVNLNSQKIIGLLAPTSGTDAANKAYVDAAAQGLDVKPSCRVASTATLTLSAPGATIDGVTMASGDRFLAKDQSTALQNGIYIWNGAAAAATRSSDADTSAEVTSGMFTFVTEGTTNSDSGWVLTTNDPITLDTTALAFAQFSGAGQITAGAGLTKTGNQLDAIGTAGRISVAADSIDIDAAYVGQATITTLGTVATGTWNATTIAVAKGGTGQTTAKAARETGLGAAGYYSSATHGAGATINITQATHLLQATRGLLVQCQIDATGAVILPDIAVAANGDVAVTFAVSQTANTIRTTIIG